MNKTKRVCMIVLLLIMMIALCACEQVQTGNRIMAGKDVQTFTYAYIKLGDQTIVEGYVNQWRDYDNSDTVQVMIDGRYYLTHYSCVVLIADPAHGNLQYSFPSVQDYGGSN